MLSISSQKTEVQNKNTLRYLMDDQDFTDVTLATGDDKQLEAHKAILSSLSPVLKNILTRNPHQKPVLYFHDIKHEILKEVLQFMYLGQTTVKENNLKKFLEVGKIFRLKELTKDKLNIHNQNFRNIASPNKPNSELEKSQNIVLETPDNIVINTPEEGIPETQDNIFMDDTLPKVKFQIGENVIVMAEYESLEVENKYIIEAQFSCDACDYKALGELEMQVHNTSMHQDNEMTLFNLNESVVSLDFNIKDEISDATLKLDIANGKTAADDTKSLSCEWCTFETTDKYEMVNHRNSAHGGKYKCRQCNSTFKTFETYVNHKFTKHKSGQCDKCGFQANNRTQFKRHNIKKHTKEYPSVVNDPSQFINAKEENAELVPRSGLVCLKCSLTFESKLELKLHLDNCILVKCEECDVERYQAQMTAHKKARHERKILDSDTYSILDDIFPEL